MLAAVKHWCADTRDMGAGAWLSSQLTDPHWVSVCAAVGLVVCGMLYVMATSLGEVLAEASAFVMLTAPVVAYCALRADHQWAWWVLVPFPAWLAIVFVVSVVGFVAFELPDWWRTRRSSGR